MNINNMSITDLSEYKAQVLAAIRMKETGREATIMFGVGFLVFSAVMFLGWALATASLSANYVYKPDMTVIITALSIAGLGSLYLKFGHYDKVDNFSKDEIQEVFFNKTGASKVFEKLNRIDRNEFGSTLVVGSSSMAQVKLDIKEVINVTPENERESFFSRIRAIEKAKNTTPNNNNTRDGIILGAILMSMASS